MEIKFTQENGRYVAHFSVSSDFNIHIEKKGGTMHFLQSTVQGGRYDLINDLNFGTDQEVIDVDCTALVYPKYIEIVSAVLPTKAVVTEKE